ncbi:hypothetical protein Glove_155g90 [Diversispora epigaea]|uniref:Uncharacterized protein n=1 Tax=Diversispora epigaea TaxID=1348612 RepID=A0A397IWV5_9GLOM|nr:hypothetical protein Glove_155g90 [Diversispora epigaea]
MNPVIYSFDNEYENLLNLSDNIQSEELNNIQINQVSDQIFNTQLIQTSSISLPPGISKFILVNEKEFKATREYLNMNPNGKGCYKKLNDTKASRAQMGIRSNNNILMKIANRIPNISRQMINRGPIQFEN